MSGAPVSQYPLPPLFYAVTAQPPALPADGADLKTFGGTVPYTPLAPDVKESNYGDQLRRCVIFFYICLFLKCMVFLQPN